MTTNNKASSAGRLAMVQAIVCLVAVATTDLLTGVELQFFVFYFMPIAWLAWKSGRWASIACAIVSAGVWMTVDIVSGHKYSHFIFELWNTVIRLIAFLAVALSVAAVRRSTQQLRQVNDELSNALNEIKTLRGVIPMCCFCRKIRNASNEWVPLESYIATHTEAQVSHGMCPSCYRKHYGEPDGT